MASTSTILSHSQTVYRAKKRAKQNQIKEVVFDDDARTEFLTGFHKRKLQRTEEKRNKAIERDKQQRLEARRESRKARAEQAKENAAAVERALGADVNTDDEDDRPRPSAKHIEDEMEFEDEELLATVTVVEDFTTDDLILGPSATRRSAADVDPSSPKPAPKSRLQLERAPSTSSSAPKPKAKDPKFRYETKAGRKATKEKQKVRRAFKATAARPSSSNKKPTQTSKRRR